MANRHLALVYCWSMILSENRHPLFGIMLQSGMANRHLALVYCWSMILSENRHPLFGIML